MKLSIQGKYYLITQAITLVAVLYTATCWYLRGNEEPQIIHVQLPVHECFHAPAASPPPPTVFNIESGKPFKIQL